MIRIVSGNRLKRDVPVVRWKGGLERLAFIYANASQIEVVYRPLLKLEAYARGWLIKTWWRWVYLSLHTPHCMRFDEFLDKEE